MANKTMSESDKKRLYDDCFNSKLGRYSSIDFCSKMYKKYPDEYKVISQQAQKDAVATVSPFNKT